MNLDVVEDEFTAGVNAYWSGECPDGWDNLDKRTRSPFLMGWYMASMWECYPGTITDRDGDPFQTEDDGY